MPDIIIIGAGASGLMAARILCARGKKILLIEARDRVGGRIETITNGFSFPAEGGAEFIHGNLETTLNLLAEAGINYTKTGGEFYRIEKGRINLQNDFFSDWDVLIRRLNLLTTDITIADFLKQYLSETKYENLRRSFIQYVQGYDAADINNTSSIAIRDEMQDEDEEQYRDDGGYIRLVNFLADECCKHDGIIKLSEQVKEIIWKKNHVEVFTEKNTYTADKIIVTVPVGILKTNPESIGAIDFNPLLPHDYQEAIAQLGSGGVIKILLEFKEAFWLDKTIIGNNKEPFFIFSDAAVPTWWTQYPDKNQLLTGWLSGPPAIKYKDLDEQEILSLTIESLASIFNIDAVTLRSNLKYYKIRNWFTENFSKCAYSYATLMQTHASNKLRGPIKDTIYFAGEAISTKGIGTVEAALVSGKETAEKILMLQK